MINPNDIPQFTGNLDLLESDAAGLVKDAGNIRTTGGDVHSSFQGLSAFYHAPEAEQLFATTKPVADTANFFAGEVEQVASALTEYAAEVRPIKAKLEQLHADATAFVDSVNGDHDWKYDSHKVNRNNDLLRQVDAAVAAFWAAERTAANKIDRIFCGTQYVGNDGSNKPNMYGYTGDQLDHGKLPWGSSEEQSHHIYDVGYWVKSFVWDGLIVDGVWGTITGIFNLVNPFDWDTFTKSWKGIGELAVGLEFLTNPWLYAIPDSALPKWVQDSKKTPLTFAKSLVAWDEWKKNPGRAAGAVAFNVLTCVVAPLKIGKLGAIGDAGAVTSKAGAATKVLSTLGTVGEVIDPMTYVGKALSPVVGKLPSVAQLAATLDRFTGSDLKSVDDLTMLHGTELPDGSLKLPDGSVLHPNGDLHPPDGEVKVLNPQELAAVHAGSGLPDTVTHTGDHLPGQVGQGGHDLPGQAGHAGDHPVESTGGPGTDHPAPGDHHDGAPGHDGGHDSGGHDGGSGSGDHPSSGPEGNRPDGSWAGENGLKLSPEANRTANDFIAHAASDEPRITTAVQAVVQHVDHGKLIGLDYRLKGEDSLKRKLATDLLNKPELTPESAMAGIRDSVRYTLEVPADHYTNGVVQAVRDLQARGFENVTFKNTWDSEGYKGINSTWRDPSTGRILELQFHTPDSFDAKMTTHGLYEQARLPGVSAEDFARLQAEQKATFGRVPIPVGAGEVHLSSLAEPAHGVGPDAAVVAHAGHDVSAGTVHGPPTTDAAHTGVSDGGHAPSLPAGNHDLSGLGSESHGAAGHVAGGSNAGHAGGSGGGHEPPSGGMRPEQEVGVTHELTRLKLSAVDQQRVLTQLRKADFGAEAADLVGRGHLSEVSNYDEVLKMFKDKTMHPAAIMALRHATDLQGHGIHDLAFEIKNDATGLDLDVATLHHDGSPHYGYQLKDVQNHAGINSAAKKAAKQLAGDGADFKIAILDIHQPMEGFTEDYLKSVEYWAGKSEATFYLRFDDGSLTVPEHGQIFP